MAAFHSIIYGRFWVITKAGTHVARGTGGSSFADGAERT
jgi:hypothetical protein